MACSDQVTTSQLEGAALDTVTIAEVATSRAGGVPSGGIVSSTKTRFGDQVDTLVGRLNKLGTKTPPIDWSAGAEVTDQVQAYRYPAGTGDIYIPKIAVPFTTSPAFDPENWILYQSGPTDDLQADQFVTSISDLVLLMPQENKIISTKGYYSAGDGGHGSYLVVNSYPGVPDEKGEAFTLANGLIAVRQGMPNIRQFGATGNGVSNDYLSIQAAIDASSVLEIPDGDFYYTTELVCNSKIVIYGEGKLKPFGIRAIQAAADGCEFRNFNIEHDISDAATATSVLFNGVNDCLAENLKIINSLSVAEAIKLKDSNRCRVKNNEMLNCRGAGVFIQGTLVGRGRDNLVSNNIISGTGYHGVYSRKESSTQNTNNIISNNSITGVGANTSASLCVGVEMWGYADIVTGNTITGVAIGSEAKAQSYIGITVGTNVNSVVSNNFVSRFVEYGIELGNVSNNCIVDSNNVRDIFDNLSSPTKGAGLAYTGTLDSTDGIFSNNNVSRCFKGLTAPFGSDIKIVGNVFNGELFDKSIINTRGIETFSSSVFLDISGNTIEGYNLGILPSEASIGNEVALISGNMFKNCNIAIRSLLKPVNINGNHFYNCGSGSSSASIQLESGSNWSVTNNSFQNNSGGTPAIVVKNDATDHGGVISSNKLMSNTVLTGPISGWVEVDSREDNLLNGSRVSYGSGVPTSGSFSVGDIVYNNAPVTLGFIGWVCVNAGSPGTWKTFGAIS